MCEDKCLKNIAEIQYVGNGRLEQAHAIPNENIRLLHDMGYFLIPCGGSDGKTPRRKAWAKPDARRMKPEDVITIMALNKSATYGVRLDGLAVIDCDTWDEETEAFVKRHFPPTAMSVKTARGRHFYYRAGDRIRGRIRCGGIKIDVKQGSGSFVVGPGSMRPDGKRYLADANCLAPKDALPILTLVEPLPIVEQAKRTPSSKSDMRLSEHDTEPSLIPRSQRNEQAFAYARQIAFSAQDVEHLYRIVRLWVDENCAAPDEISDAEVRKICSSVWRYRMTGRLISGSNSTFSHPRQALDQITRLAGTMAANCCLLYCALVSNHGHLPDRPFAIDARGMSEARVVPLSKSAIDRAKQKLKELDLIRLLRKGRTKEPDLYLLTPADRIAHGNKKKEKEV